MLKEFTHMIPSLKRPRKRTRKLSGKLSKYLVMIMILFLLPFIFTLAVPDEGTGKGLPGTNPVSVFADAASFTGSSPDAKTELRGLWVATVLNLDYPSQPGTDSETLKSEAGKIIEYASDTGFNAIFLQVRPTADAFYKSSLFPWSKYLSGTQGLAPGNSFDPLKFWVDEAHKRGIEVHAWINPYRITKKTSDEPVQDLKTLDASNPAVKNPSWVVKYSDGNLYFNPGIPGVRKMITDSVLEIIGGYDVDGIHMDDYFYPGKNFNDGAAYIKYGSGYKSIDDWRRSNVDILISDISKTIKASGREVRFGISPFGIWANKDKNLLGSDTRGLQSYYDHYADSRKWVKEGLIDYIAPQIYWNVGYSVADYSKLLLWWKDVTSGTGVDLYIGQAAYRAGNSDRTSSWYGISEIEKQLKLNDTLPEVKGSIFFRYKSLEELPALSAAMKAYYSKKDGIATSVSVTIARPVANISTSYGTYYLSGVSDPTKPLFINGQSLAGRSSAGYYGILVKLEEGVNIFTVSQDASYATRVIYRTKASSPQKMDRAEIISASTFPQSQEYRMPGEKITLSCKAPSGAKVTVKLGSKSYHMKQTSSSIGSGLYAATFTYVHTLPASYTGSPRNIVIGTPVYTMNYGGKTRSLSAPAKISVIMKESPFYAMINHDTVIAYKSPTSSNGVRFELYKGMSDYITGMTGSFVRLSSGLWVKTSDVKTYSSKSQFRPEIRGASYTTGDRWDELKLSIQASKAVTSAVPASVAATATFDGAVMKFVLSTASTAPQAPIPTLPMDSLFSGVTVSRDGYKAIYELTLKDGQRCDGYYVENTADGLVLHIKRHASPVNSSGTGLTAGTLSGYTIMVDPGHGGSDAGAIGPTGMTYPEKTINLSISLKLKAELESLGAKVLMTRTADTTVSLNERLSASRKTRPDLFISVHANSMEDNVDISKYEGFSSYYREELSKQLAEAVYNRIISSLSRYPRGVHDKNFFVTTATWAPSILIESGFVPHPSEHEWLINGDNQARLAANLAVAIEEYFIN